MPVWAWALWTLSSRVVDEDELGDRRGAGRDHGDLVNPWWQGADVGAPAALAVVDGRMVQPVPGLVFDGDGGICRAVDPGQGDRELGAGIDQVGQADAEV